MICYCVLFVHFVRFSSKQSATKTWGFTTIRTYLPPLYFNDLGIPNPLATVAVIHSSDTLVNFMIYQRWWVSMVVLK